MSRMVCLVWADLALGGYGTGCMLAYLTLPKTLARTARGSVRREDHCFSLPTHSYSDLPLEDFAFSFWFPIRLYSACLSLLVCLSEVARYHHERS